MTVMFVNAMHTFVLRGDLFTHSGVLLNNMYSMYKMGGNKMHLCLRVSCQRAISDLNGSVSQKLIP